MSITGPHVPGHCCQPPSLTFRQISNPMTRLRNLNEASQGRTKREQDATTSTHLHNTQKPLQKHVQLTDENANGCPSHFHLMTNHINTCTYLQCASTTKCHSLPVIVSTKHTGASVNVLGSCQGNARYESWLEERHCHRVSTVSTGKCQDNDINHSMITLFHTFSTHIHCHPVTLHYSPTY
jgi:hypothetical protein